MTTVAIVIAVICQLFLVGGQVFLKRAMATDETGFTPRAAARLVPGVACLSVWFFLWLGLLQEWELSHVYPFEGLDPVLVVLAAWLFFRERISPAAWVGIVLIAGGVALVSGS